VLLPHQQRYVHHSVFSFCQILSKRGDVNSLSSSTPIGPRLIFFCDLICLATGPLISLFFDEISSGLYVFASSCARYLHLPVYFLPWERSVGSFIFLHSPLFSFPVTDLIRVVPFSCHPAGRLFEKLFTCPFQLVGFLRPTFFLLFSVPWEYPAYPNCASNLARR